MSPRTLVSIFSAICLLLSTGASAQVSDTVSVESDSVQRANRRDPQRDTSSTRFIPTGVRLGTDLMTIGKTQFTEEFKGWELTADVDFYRYFLTVEYGQWATMYGLRNGIYTNDGNYYRIGVDVNFLVKDPEKNMFFLGGRFGHSTFSDEVTYTTQTLQFPENLMNAQNPLVVATWVELTPGLKVKIW
jgi:hypothetical protein